MIKILFRIQCLILNNIFFPVHDTLKSLSKAILTERERLKHAVEQERKTASLGQNQSLRNALAEVCFRGLGLQNEIKNLFHVVYSLWKRAIDRDSRQLSNLWKMYIYITKELNSCKYWCPSSNTSIRTWNSVFGLTQMSSKVIGQLVVKVATLQNMVFLWLDLCRLCRSILSWHMMVCDVTVGCLAVVWRLLGKNTAKEGTSRQDASLLRRFHDTLTIPLFSRRWNRTQS